MVKVRVAVILRRGGKILLVKHLKRGRGYWVVPGGALERGETLEQAAVREVREETGLRIKIEKLAFVGDFIPPGGRRHAVDFFFTGRIISGSLKKGCDRFLDDLRFFRVSELDKLELYPYILYEIKKGLKDNFSSPACYIGNRAGAGAAPKKDLR